MIESIFGLLTVGAVLSSAILKAGKENFAYGTSNISVFYPYLAMGVGNNTAVAASENNSGIYGNESYYASVNASYQADYRGVWEYTFGYTDLPSHIFSEAVIARNKTQYTDYCLARIVFDSITLNLSDTLKVGLTVGF